MTKRTFVVIQQYSHAEPIVVFRELNGTKLKAKSVEELDHNWCATFEMPIAGTNKTNIEKFFFIKDEADGNDTYLTSLYYNNNNTKARHKVLNTRGNSFIVKSYDLT
jgi:hypothetical protein